MMYTRWVQEILQNEISIDLVMIVEVVERGRLQNQKKKAESFMFELNRK